MKDLIIFVTISLKERIITRWEYRLRESFVMDHVFDS